MKEGYRNAAFKARGGRWTEYKEVDRKLVQLKVFIQTIRFKARTMVWALFLIFDCIFSFLSLHI